MKRLVAVLALLVHLIPLQSFTLPRQWIPRIQTTRHTASVDIVNRKLNEVYVGNLPPNFNVLELNALLLQKGISNQINTSVSSYGTTDCGLFGTLSFNDVHCATEAISALEGTEVGNRTVDVSLMPTVCKVIVDFDREYDMHHIRNFLMDLRKHDSVDTVGFNLKGSEFHGAFVKCWNPPLAARLLCYLSENVKTVRAWLNPHQEDTNCISMTNLDPKITQDFITSVLNELLDPNYINTVRLKHFGMGDNFHKVAYVNFVTLEGAEKAVEVLNGYNLMGRPVVVERMLKMEEKRFGMSLLNVDPEVSAECIKSLCNDAVGDSSAVLSVKMNYYQGVAISSRTVYFTSAESCAECIKKLNGLLWKEKTLSAAELTSHSKARSTLFVKNIPLAWTEAQTKKEIGWILGDTPFKNIQWKNTFANYKKQARFVFVEFYSEEHASDALVKLNGAKSDLRASVSRESNLLTSTDKL